jgi:predicted Zn finger-like uncharacterized protein
MANVISCPKCERQLRVPDDLLGQNVKCPSCNETFTAEMTKKAPPPSAPATTPSRSSSRARDDEDEERPSRRRPPRRDDDDDDDDGRRPSRRRHLAPHRGDTIQLLGILSFFLVPLVLGPCAWIMGNGDLAEMDAGRMDPAGRKGTETGRMCGKIATIIYGSLVIVVPLAWFGCCCFLNILGAGASAGGAGGAHPPGRRY